jgi:Tol biopolymer transport system component
LGLLPSALRLSADGSRLAYRDSHDNKDTTFVTDPGTTSTRALCEGSCSVLDFFSNPGEALVVYNNQLVRQNLTTGSRQPLLTVDRGRVFEASVSPGDRRLAFTVERPNGTAALYMAPLTLPPAPPETWNLIAQDRDALTAPRWSPKGRFLFFGSKRDGFPCVWAQRIAGNGKPLGTPVAVFHSHASSIMKMAGEAFYSITRDRLYMTAWDMKGNIWTLNVGSQ